MAIIKKTRKKFLDRLVEVALLTRPSLGVDFFVYTPQELEQAEAQGNRFIQDEILRKGKILYAQ